MAALVVACAALVAACATEASSERPARTAAQQSRDGCAWSNGLRGRPHRAARRRSGLTVWFARRWHVRARGGGSARTFTGTLATSTPAGRPRTAGLERRDSATRDGEAIAFRLHVAAGDVDRIAVSLPCGDVSLAVERDGAAAPASRLRVGRRAARAPSATFTAPAPARSGATGQVTRSSGCPVEGVPECKGGRQPAQATVDVDAVEGGKDEPESARRVASVPTDAEGRFAVDLPPGDYRFTARSSDGATPEGGAVPASARVVEGVVTHVDVPVERGVY